jgi:hypothetical protein
MITGARTPTSWIGGRRFDLFFFFGSGGIAMLSGIVVLRWPQLLLPLWIAWLWLVDGPHLVATWSRTYCHDEERAKRKTLLLASPLLFVPGFAALGLSNITGSSAPFVFFLAVAALWSFHHAVRQHFGVLAIYQRFANACPRAKRIDSWFLYTVFWASFGLFLLSNAENRKIIGLPISTISITRMLSIAIAGGVTILLIAYVIRTAIQFRQGISARPALFVLLPAVATTLFSFFVIGPFEPIAQNIQTPEQVFMTVAMMTGVLHGMQYLGIVFAANRRRWQAHDSSVFARIGHAPLLSYLLFVAVSVGYLGLNFARGASPTGSFFAESTTAGKLFLCFYWGLFFHHYYLDQKIWRVSKDPVLQFELGLTEAR